MAIFAYQALDNTGKQVTGTITADARATAIDQVAALGLHPISVSQPEHAAPRQRLLTRGRISQAHVESFTRQLAGLLAAGVSLSRSLEILAGESTAGAAREQRVAIHDDVVGGMSLADALAKWPKSFPPVYVAMVRAGETGGFLELVLEQIADFRTRERDLKGKVTAALIYPAVLAVLAIVVLILLLTFFIPRFSTIFAEYGGALPLLTRAIIASSHVVVHYGVFAGIAIVLTVVGMKRISSSDAGRRQIEQLLLRLPGFGKVIAHFALVRFTRMLGTLLGAGVPLLPALRVAREAIGNQTLADTVDHAVEQVKRGASLARSLSASAVLFPPSVIEVVAVAEESGRLDKELVRTAQSYEGELDRRLRMLVALLEPALLFLMAAFVGTIVIGMLLPVFTLQDLIR